MKMTKAIAIVLAIVLLAGAGLVRRREVLHSETFQTPVGWGYNILLKERVLIHQQYVPAQPRLRGFRTRAAAEATARLVMEKMKAAELPSVSEKEIEQIETMNQ